MDKSVHIHNRQIKTRKSTEATSRIGGFTLLEVAIAIVIFLAFAGIVTFSIARSQIAVANVQLERAVKTEMNKLLNQTSTIAYHELLSENFIRPQACDYNMRFTCVNVRGRDVEIQWQVVRGDDQVEYSTANPDTLLLLTVAKMPNGQDVEVGRTVANPTRSGTLRVRVRGETYTGPVYLFDSENNLLTGARTVNGVATMRSDPENCTVLEPCFLGLRPDGSAMTSDVSMSAGNVASSAADVILSANNITERSIVVNPVPSVTLILEGRNLDGRVQSPVTLGSVCLWLEFSTVGETRHVQGCNTDRADRIVIDAYEINEDGLKVGLPPNTNIRVLSDHPDLSCPNGEGQVVYNGTEWVSSTETHNSCTRHTWGDPTRWGASFGASYQDFENATFTLTGSSRRYFRVGWVSHSSTLGSAPSQPEAASYSDQIYPAIGYWGEAMWEAARDCDTDTICVEPSNWEPDICVGEHCLSSVNSAPTLEEHTRGTFGIQAIPMTTSGSFTVTLTFRDRENDGFVVESLKSSFSNLTVEYQDGGWTSVPTGVFEGGLGSTSVDIRFNATDAFAGESWPIRLTDNDGNSRDIVLSLPRHGGDVQVARIDADILQGRQTQTANGTIRVIGDDGEPYTSADLEFAGLPATSSSSFVHTSNGLYSLNLELNNAPSGSHTHNVSVTNGIVGHSDTNGRLQVLQGAVSFTLDLEHDNLAQSGSILVDVQATDAAGFNAAGQHLWFRASSGGNTSRGLIFDPAGCVTDGSGRCETTVTAETHADLGAVLVNVYSKTGTSSTVMTVVNHPYQLRADDFDIIQGSSTGMFVSVKDAFNNPVVNSTVSVSGAPEGLVFGADGSTNENGEVTISVTADSDIEQGVYPVTVTSQGIEVQTDVTVVSQVTNIDSSLVELAQGETSSISIRAFDINNDPVGNTTLHLQPPTNAVQTPGQVSTDGDGWAEIELLVFEHAPLGLIDPIVVLHNGQSVGEIEVNVLQGVASISATGVLNSGSSGEINFTFRSSDSSPVPNREMIVSTNIQLFVIEEVTEESSNCGEGGGSTAPNQAVVCSNGVGQLELTLTPAPGLVAGSYNVGFYVDGRWKNATVIVQ